MQDFGQENHSEIPITKAQATQAEKEAKAAGSALLDNIEATRREQGNYFFEIGKTTNIETPNEGENDPRLIALKTPVQIKEGDTPRAVVITQDGPFYVSGGTTYTQKVGEQEFYYREGLHIDNPSNQFIARMKEVQDGLNKGEYVPAGDKPAFVSTHGYGSHERRMEFELTPINDLDTVVKARDESIKNTESPHKARLETAQARTAVINSLSQDMSQLPPR